MKVVELENVLVVVKGANELYDGYLTVERGKAVVEMTEPESICIGERIIKNEDELPSRIEKCTMEIYNGAEMLVSTKDGLVYFIGDLEFGEICIIPEHWLEVLGWRRGGDE